MKRVLRISANTFRSLVELTKKARGRKTGPSSTTPQLSMVMSGYFFFADFLAPPFLAPPLPPFFAAILLTTFHAVRDLTVAPTWHNAPEFSGTT